MRDNKANASAPGAGPGSCASRASESTKRRGYARKADVGCHLGSKWPAIVSASCIGHGQTPSAAQNLCLTQASFAGDRYPTIDMGTTTRLSSLSSRTLIRILKSHAIHILGHFARPRSYCHPHAICAESSSVGEARRWTHIQCTRAAQSR